MTVVLDKNYVKCPSCGSCNFSDRYSCWFCGEVLKDAKNKEVFERD